MASPGEAMRAVLGLPDPPWWAVVAVVAALVWYGWRRTVLALAVWAWQAWRHRSGDRRGDGHGDGPR